jgi:hypothetical protein
MGKCSFCEKEAEVKWCAGCAKDTCRECWPIHVPECFNAQGKECHQCGKSIRRVESIDDASGIVMQSFTGRMFCGVECFSEYQADEGQETCKHENTSTFFAGGSEYDVTCDDCGKSLS